MTAPRASLVSVTPMIPAGGSLADAVKVWTEQLGFSVSWMGGTMAGITRDAISFNLIENNNREWAENASFSISVTDLDAIYDEFRDVAARVGPLEMKSWGRREFHMIVPGGVCLQFYQAGA